MQAMQQSLNSRLTDNIVTDPKAHFYDFMTFCHAHCYLMSCTAHESSASIELQCLVTKAKVCVKNVMSESLCDSEMTYGYIQGGPGCPRTSNQTTEFF